MLALLLTVAPPRHGPLHGRNSVYDIHGLLSRHLEFEIDTVDLARISLPFRPSNANGSLTFDVKKITRARVGEGSLAFPIHDRADTLRRDLAQ